MIGISDLKASKSFCSEGYDRKVFSVWFLLSVGPLWSYICTYFYCSLIKKGISCLGPVPAELQLIVVSNSTFLGVTYVPSLPET